MGKTVQALLAEKWGETGRREGRWWWCGGGVNVVGNTCMQDILYRDMRVLVKPRGEERDDGGGVVG